jgi:hypothetical protein
MVTVLYPFSGVSPFQHLTIGVRDENQICGLLRQLAMKSPTQMTSLTLLDHMTPAKTVALARFLKSAVHLTKLSVYIKPEDKALRDMLEQSIRENGSVQDLCSGLKQVYCQRNTNIPLFLMQRPLPATDLSMVPTFFHVAKVAKKMAPTMIIMGLLGGDHLNGQYDEPA